jgi:predicted transcriptional regulator
MMARRPKYISGAESETRGGLTQIMGDLEAEVMECVWDLGSAQVKDVRERLLQRRDIAYTTVMTVMSRLAAKGFLVSHPLGRAYVYEPVSGREEFCAGVARDLMSGVVAGADREVLAQFVESVTANDMQQLDVLAQIIEEKRRERSSLG